jgi:hypothetical protein
VTTTPEEEPITLEIQDGAIGSGTDFETEENS